MWQFTLIKDEDQNQKLNTEKEKRKTEAKMVL